MKVSTRVAALFLVLAAALSGCMGARTALAIDELTSDMQEIPASCGDLSAELAAAYFDCGDDARVVYCPPDAGLYADATVWPAPLKPGALPLGGVGDKKPWCLDEGTYPADAAP